MLRAIAQFLITVIGSTCIGIHIFFAYKEYQNLPRKLKSTPLSKAARIHIIGILASALVVMIITIAEASRVTNTIYTLEFLSGIGILVFGIGASIYLSIVDRNMLKPVHAPANNNPPIIEATYVDLSKNSGVDADINPDNMRPMLESANRKGTD